MSHHETPTRILEAVKSSSEPALSAKQIAERLGVSVKTVHNNITELVESGSLQTTEIGNATAYYTGSDDTREGGEMHSCKRCNRRVEPFRDLARIDLKCQFEDSRDVSREEFYILCRFCYSDLISWLFGDTGMIGYHSSVHSWDIPEEQLKEVQEDKDKVSMPRTDSYNEFKLEVLDTIVDMYEEGSEGVSSSKIAAEMGINSMDEKMEFNQCLQSLETTGAVQKSFLGYVPAQDDSTEKEVNETMRPDDSPQ